VDDVLSQVVRMEFFGSKTAPCKNPADKSSNAKFYTIPVKFMFKDRKSAQTAADMLREYMGINSTTPYHKSLRAAMNKVINKAKTENPGYQAKTNLDLNGKTLKCFIRPDIKPPGSSDSSSMDTDVTVTAVSGKDNQEEQLMKQLAEVNKVSSPLPEFMQTPKNKNKGNTDKSTFKKSSLIQHSPPAKSRHSTGSFGS